jgi:hypothetical protein
MCKPMLSVCDINILDTIMHIHNVGISDIKTIFKTLLIIVFFLIVMQR